MLLTGLSFSVGQASALVSPAAFEIQNQATGLCIQATSDVHPYQIELHPCGSSDDQYFGVRDHNTFVDLATGGTCLATDTQGNALSVLCGESAYNVHWMAGSVQGDWTTISSPNGCYLKILNGMTPACMPGFQGSNAQWRMIYGHPNHHNGTEAGMGRVKWADFDGDGKADYLTIGADGAVNVWLNKGGDGHGGWQALGQVATGLTSDTSRVRFADFDGDGLADYLCINPDGSVHVYLNRGGDGHGGWQDLGQVATGLTSDASRVRFADIDGDGRADYNVINADGSVTTYLNNGGDSGAGWVNYGQIATGFTTDPSRVRLADIDGDGKADYSVINGSGAVSTYLNRGGDGHGGWSDYGQIATGVTSDQNAVALADFTGDGMADYISTNPNGSVNVFRNDGGDGHGGWTDLGQIATGA
ncbi:VCBS repeat-containing protein [Streptomyces kaniharaensis]|uniref:VCBS repeat-containing protein n=2 Tax=Streptomyces kaniharaensis TaxID=212423 RepID=A0A6N7KYR4_9ACTN|nr:VCBS repeat-containing protein [Streptomyces kaniharaensis]